MNAILWLSLSLMSSCEPYVEQSAGSSERVFVLHIDEEPARLEIFEALQNSATNHLESERSFEGSPNAFLTTGASLLMGPSQRRLEAAFIEPDASRYGDFKEALDLGSDPDEASVPWAEEPLPAVTASGGSGHLQAAVAIPCQVDAQVTLKLETLLFSEVSSRGRVYRLPHPDDDIGSTRVIVKGGKALINGKLRAKARIFNGEDIEVRALEHRSFSSDIVKGLSSTLDAQIFRVSRMEFDVNQTAEPPGALAMVFVVDRSVSRRERGLQNDRELIEKVLAAAPPGSAYSVIAFAHDVQVMVPPFTPRLNLSALRAGFKKLARANGSLLEPALKKARGILADSGAREGRMFVLSDAELPSVDDSLRGERALSDVVTHVIDTENSGQFIRQENRPAVANTGGVWVGTGEEGLSSLAPYLIRPTQLDDVKVLLAGEKEVTRLARQAESFSSDEDSLQITSAPSVLLENTSYSIFVEDDAPEGANSPDEIQGMLWMKPVRFHLQRRAAFSHGHRGVMASGDYANAIAPDQRLQFAEEAGVLNGDRALEFVPAYRAPPEEGLGMRGASSGACGCGGRAAFSTGHTSRCGIAGLVNAFDRNVHELLTERLETLYATCGEVHGTLTIEYRAMELTWVSATRAQGSARSSRCAEKVFYDWLLEEARVDDDDFRQFSSAGTVQLEY